MSRLVQRGACPATGAPTLRIMRLAGDRRGLALLEFALVLPPLLLLVALIADLGFAYHSRLDTLRGVTAGAMYAFEHGGDVTAANAEAFRRTIADIVTQGAGTTAPTVTVMVNTVAGSSTADLFYCTSGTPTQYRSTGSTSAACGDNTMSAKFVTIRAQGQARVTIPFLSIGSRLFPTTDSIVVRAK